RPVGSQVRWVIPNQGIRFNSISKGRLCRSFNKLDVTIDTMLVMGESVRLICYVSGTALQLNTDVSLHFAQKLALTRGMQTIVALKSEQIHILE
ncbi:MAG: ABC transporter ATP-binding protein, partial [Shewanella sp.]